MRTLWEVAARHTLMRLVFFLPSARRKSLERWLRGREENRKLAAADFAVVSWGKSGRTWLRLMLSRFYQEKYGLPERTFLNFDNLARRHAEIPRTFFTHGNYLRDYTGNWDSKTDFYRIPILLLVRDPRDIAVSQYFQWKNRMLPRKKFLNDYPAHGEEVSIYDFVMKREVGLSRVIDFFSLWSQELSKVENALVVRYEDLRAEPVEWLKRILEFLGTPGSDQEIEEAVSYAAYENMKKLERTGVFRGSGRRLVPGNRSNPDSYKVRRAVVGGYRDYFDAQQIAEIDERVAKELPPRFGYGA